MKLEDQVTSLEFSKKLKELGVVQESVFYWHKPDALEKHELVSQDLGWDCYCDSEPGENHRCILSELADPENEDQYDSDICYAAFTVAELGEMLPPNEVFPECYRNDELEWVINYTANHQDFAVTEADARAKMLIHLIEQGKS